MSEQEIEAEAQRLHKQGSATVKRMREAHGMTHKFPTGPDAYSQDPELFLGVVNNKKPHADLAWDPIQASRNRSAGQLRRQARERAEKGETR